MTEEIEHEYTDEIVCPYCGYEYSDCYEFSEDDSEIECDGCNKNFSYSRHVEVTYVTSKLCKQNNTPHEWGEPSTPHQCHGKWISGKHCKICNQCELVEVDQVTHQVLHENSISRDIKE